jgi:aspartate carbamoyltransferase catalytic subunit
MTDVHAPAALEAFRGRSVVSADDLTKEEVLALLDVARAFDPPASVRADAALRDRILGTLFFEPSTRTRLSFESAMLRLGGSVVGFADANQSSSSKGESLSDTVRVVASYCDVIVIRHPKEGAARLAAQVAGIPVVNGGDGSNQHPTQTLLDLYTIRKATGRLEGLRVAFLGDLRYGRTVHSLARALCRFDAELSFVGPPTLRLPDELRETVRASGRPPRELDSLDDLGAVDVLYVTRIQKERFPDALDYERVRNAYRIDRASVRRFGEGLKILHPLPRVTEVDPDLDAHPGALWFEQVRNGVSVRMTLLSLLLGGRVPARRA